MAWKNKQVVVETEPVFKVEIVGVYRDKLVRDDKGLVQEFLIWSSQSRITPDSISVAGGGRLLAYFPTVYKDRIEEFFRNNKC